MDKTNSQDQFELFKTFDGTLLNGAWKIPAGAVKACALILPGSGNVGMDGDVSSPILGYPYRSEKAPLSEQLAEALADIGVASFRYAKRGYDDPTQLQNQTREYLAQDTLVAAAQVRKRFNSCKLFAVAFSEGAILALLNSDKTKWDRMFLLGPPTRTIDQIFTYQFLDWPTQLLKMQLDPDRDGILAQKDLALLANEYLPLLGAPWQTLGSGNFDSLSLAKQVLPAYQSLLGNVLDLMRSPPYSAWYNSMKNLPPFESLAKQSTSPAWLYQGKCDAQVSSEWLLADQAQFPLKQKMRVYSGLGHCFSPHEGHFGEMKTSGPINIEVLIDLQQDVKGAI